ncbi:MAG: phenylalanine--tRNA ligase subunit beta, partial [Proteobacteria bacterium]|nr:phenylalanine--tRNA ligase subunit beta [Pseudomonadota bacterium]
MKFSEKWLRQWVDPKISSDELMEQLTMLGLEVDGVEAAAGNFSNVVVAEIISAEKHPDADKLQVCQVKTHDSQFQIVCGAPNARVGLKSPLALVGAVLPGDFKIKKSKLRGVESCGMLCSEVELGIGTESNGIMELEENAPIGFDLNEYLELDDQLIEIDLTPNRADCFSIRGIAREVATINTMSINEVTIKPVPSSIDEKTPLEILAKKQCPKYLSRIINGINNNASSPLWLKEKLRRSGIRSIHPVVDITNYVMLELGQPMHAFDKSQIKEKIVVRMAQDDEKITLLDESEVTVDSSFLLIADAEKALAVAGVIGGLHSGVSSGTTDIVLESAYFDPATIMGKSRKLAVHTESSMRFERGVDVDLQEQAMQRATALIIEICGGEVSQINAECFDQELPKSNNIILMKNHLTRVLGFSVDDTKVCQIFDSLGFDLVQSDEYWQVNTPSWRFDLSIAEDLIEEVVRVVGYDQMPATRLHSTDTIRVIPEQIQQSRLIHAQLAQLSYQEVINYSFVAEKQLSAIHLLNNSFALANALNNDMAVMRTSLLPGLLANIKHNLTRQHNDLAFYEIGKVFHKNKDIVETNKLMLAICGQKPPEQWSQKSANADFFDIKGDVESLIACCDKKIEFIPSSYRFLHPGRQAELVLDGKKIGYIGQVHPSICKKSKIKKELYVAELDIADLNRVKLPAWQEVSKFPTVRRD